MLETTNELAIDAIADRVLDSSQVDSLALATLLGKRGSGCPTVTFLLEHYGLYTEALLSKEVERFATLQNYLVCTSTQRRRWLLEWRVGGPSVRPLY